VTDTRICYKCGRELPSTAFLKAGVRDGVQRYRPSCKQCEALAADIRREKRRGAVEPDRACTGCGVVKPATDFYRNDDGRRRSECKVCFAAKVRARYHEGMRDEAYREHRHALANARNRRRWYRSVIGQERDR